MFKPNPAINNISEGDFTSCLETSKDIGLSDDGFNDNRSAVVGDISTNTLIKKKRLNI